MADLGWQAILDRPNAELWDYNATDVEETWVAAVKLREDLKFFDVRGCHDLMLSLALPAYRMQERGMLVDSDRRETLRAGVNMQLEERRQTVAKAFSDALGEEYCAAVAMGGVLRRLLNPRRKAQVKGTAFNPRSKPHLVLLLQALGMRWPQVTESGRTALTLNVVNKLRRAYPQHEELLCTLWEYAKLEKLRADWLEDSDGKRLLCDDQRLRASVRVTGTQSGRFSEAGREWCARCQKPDHGRNRQNLPKTDDPFCAAHAPIRSMVVPGPGRAFVKADYRALEAWIAARVSGDAEFVRRLESGDVHTANARDLFGIPSTESVPGELRRLAKIFLFGGVLYKGGPETVQASYEKVGIVVPLADIKKYQARWKVRHQRFVNWQAELVANACRLRPARVRTALGRHRLFWGPPKAWEKEAIAHVISGTGADYTNLALRDLDARWAGTDRWILLHEHDGLLVECDIPDVPEVAAEMRDAFETARSPLGIFRCDVSVSTTTLQEAHPWDGSST